LEKPTDARQPVVSEERATSVVELHKVRIQKNGTVTGWVVNKSDHPVRDVRLLIRHAWLWRDELHPGTNNPGRSAYYSVRMEVPPGNGTPFVYRPKPPLPSRRDGWFQTSAEVVGFVEVGPGGTASAGSAQLQGKKKGSLKWPDFKVPEMPAWSKKLWPFKKE